MAVIVKKTAITIFLIGLLILTVLSIVGMVYLSKMAFNSEQQPDGNYCGNITSTERNIARIAVITVWLQFVWIVMGSLIQSVWSV
jgi:hypothetical protein